MLRRKKILAKRRGEVRRNRKITREFTYSNKI